ncbi:MAG: hypothetical protein S4CHLAM102_01310 [Chlamydiia bacterium]|nr:hypothetical protein [Chlamydiia bacterium]
MKGLSIISLILIEIAALNCGLIGFFDYNFISVIFGGAASGDYSIIGRIVFAIFGLAGIWGLSFFGRIGCLSKEASSTDHLSDEDED